MKSDIYQKITNQIVSKLEQGVRPWHQPWNAEHASGRITRPLRANGIPYNGINVLVLWSEAIDKGFTSNIWMTYRQATALKANVRKGEHGSQVVYADKIICSETDPDGAEQIERAIPFLKGYTVFNTDQIDGLPEQYLVKPDIQLNPIERIAEADRFFKATGANLVHGGSRACYVPSTDNIHMPCIDFFEDAASYYSTLAHEATHWTRHPSRLNREFGRRRFGDEGYGMEELVAELGSAFLAADLDLVPDVRDDHASYIASWIRVLANDTRAIFTAASYAQRAADFLHSFQQPAAATEDAA